MPYVNICCLSLCSQDLIIMVSTGMEITGPHTGNWTCDWLCTSGTLWTKLPRVDCLMPSDFHHFLAFTSPKQSVTCRQTPDYFCIRIQHFEPDVTNVQISAVTTWRSGVYHLLQCAMYKPNSRQGSSYQSVCHAIFLYLFVVLYLC